MTEENKAFRQFLSEDMLDVLVKVGLIGLMVVMCFRIFAPFIIIRPGKIDRSSGFT